MPGAPRPAPTTARALLAYYAGLTRALLSQDGASGEADLLYFFLAQPVRLWNRPCRIEGDTFARYVARSGVRLPPWSMRSRLVVLAALYAWPALACLVTRRHRGRALEQWRNALRRPDLYATFPEMRFDPRAVDQRRADVFVAIYNAYDYHARRSDSYAIEDKRVFFERASAAGIPCVPMLSREEAARSGGPFIVKRADLDMGLGVRRVADVHALAALDISPAELIQPCLENHPALTDIVPAGAPLCTLRLLTTRRGAGDFTCHVGYFRIGSAGSVVDNVSRGGLLCEVDLDTGCLDAGLTHDMLHGRAPVEPVRSIGGAGELVGRKLPHLREAVALCRDAHARLAPDLVSIGWDIALAAAGPVLVECNVFAGSFELRRFHDSFAVTQAAVRAHLAEFHGRAARPAHASQPEVIAP